MKKTLITLSLFTSLGAMAQSVGINSTGVTPDASSILDVTATDKGVLIPRVDIADLSTQAPITSPATSLLVFNTNTTTGKGYYYWNGTQWTKLMDTGSNPDADWYKVGTTSAPSNINDDIFTQGKVGIGTTTTEELLNIQESISNYSLIKLTASSGSGGFLLGYSDATYDQISLDVNRNPRTGTFLDATRGNSRILLKGTTVGSNITFHTSNNINTIGIERMRVNEIGNVGIGIINPQNRLVISNGNSPNKSISINGFDSGMTDLATLLPTLGSHFGGLIQGGTNGNLVLGIRDNDGNDGLLIASGNGNYMTDNTYDNAILFARNDGNIGINTVTPTEKLEIQGSIKIVDGTQATGKVLTSDATGKGSWQNTITSQVGDFMVSGTGGFNWIAGSTLIFDTELLDPESIYSFSGGNILVAQPGIYLIIATVETGQSSYLYWDLEVDGIMQRRHHQTPGGNNSNWTSGSVTAICTLNAGSLVSLKNNSGNTIFVNKNANNKVWNPRVLITRLR